MRSNQQFVKRFLTLAIVLSFAISLFSIAIHPVRGQDFAANVNPLGGLVQHQSGSEAWKTITEVTLLKPGDKLRTADTGAAEISTSTGITIRIYPNTLVELAGLALGSEDSSVKLRLNHLVGITHVSIDRDLTPGDLVQIAMPGAAATVKGTKFFTGVGSDGQSFVIGEENTVKVQSGTGASLDNGPAQMTYFPLSAPGKNPPGTCSAAFLNSNKGTLLTDLDSDAAKQVLRRFLIDYLNSNANTRAVEGIGRLIGAQTQSVTELIDTVVNMNTSTTLTDLLTNMRSFLQSYFDAHANTPLAPGTCGNGIKDEGEDETNCKLDIADVSASCGNNLCEADAGESHINCAKDCFYGGANSCVDKQGEKVKSSGNQNTGNTSSGGGFTPQCPTLLWDPNTTFVPGARVFHNNRQWRANNQTQGQEPVTGSPIWVNLGACKNPPQPTPTLPPPPPASGVGK